jgi:hypothetical protein
VFFVTNLSERVSELWCCVVCVCSHGTATFFGRNSAQSTILAQLFIMLALAGVTLRWATLPHAEFELGRAGLAEPCLPPAVNVWRVYIFVAYVLAAALCADFSL